MADGVLSRNQLRGTAWWRLYHGIYADSSLRDLSLLGWRVMRFNADDVLRFPDRMVVQIRAALGGS